MYYTFSCTLLVQFFNFSLDDAVCTVFGDDYYSTFDGRIYTFQGACKYILVQDCAEKSFTVKVRNGVHFNSGYVWTRMLTIIIGKIRISLLQNLRVKVNGKRINIPYYYFEGVAFHLRRHGHSLQLRTNFGIGLFWEGNNFLEIAIKSTLKNKLSGLCGNYNGVKSDDFTGKDGVIYMDENRFGDSWRVGSWMACEARTQLLDTQSVCMKSPKIVERALRVCNAFYENDLKPCWDVISLEPYVRYVIGQLPYKNIKLVITFCSLIYFYVFSANTGCFTKFDII